MYNYYAMLRSYITHPHYLARASHLKHSNSGQQTGEHDFTSTRVDSNDFILLQHNLNSINSALISYAPLFTCLHCTTNINSICCSRVCQLSCVLVFFSSIAQLHIPICRQPDNRQWTEEKMRTIFFREKKKKNSVTRALGERHSLNYKRKIDFQM